MFAFVTIVEPQFDSVNAVRKGALKSHIFGAPKAGDRWNAPVLCKPAQDRLDLCNSGEKFFTNIPQRITSFLLPEHHLHQRILAVLRGSA